ncbi:hypothetical protein JXQ31_06585 [candidate division KSB1 bacterium]|nr:hypothetical protein [candidate division KSB1 bacterium]
MLKLRFNYRDLFNAPRLAFSIQRIWIQFIGMVIGYVGYLIFTYLSYFLNNYSFDIVWKKYGLLPCLFTSGEVVPWYSWVLFVIGSVFLFFAYLVTNTAVARAVYMTGKGNHFYSWKEAFAFAFRKIWSILLTPVSIVVLIGLMILGSLVIGLLGKIPFIGEIGISVFTVFWFIGALIIFFFAIVVVVAVLLVPGIIATTDEDAFEAVFQVFSVTWGQPCRLIFYQFISIVLATVSFAVFAIAVKQAVLIMNGLFINFMGSDFMNLCNNGQAIVQNWTFMLQGIIDGAFKGLSPLIYFSHNFTLIPAADLNISVTISSYIYAISLLIIGGWVISYGLSTFTTGNTLLYLVLRKYKDDENLLEREDAEEENEESEETTEEDKEEPEED